MRISKRDLASALNFDALVLFVNPPLSLPPPSETKLIEPGSALRVLGPDKAYRFAADATYDWGEDVAGYGVSRPG